MPPPKQPFVSWAAALFVAIPAALFAIQAQAAEAKPFDAAKAFCERQTFVLERIEEVGPWLDHFSGLRNGRSPAPDANCPSSTVRAILNVVTSSTLELAETQRSALFSFYVSRSMGPELGDRIVDPDGSFRYRSDVVLMSFVWLLCPGHGEERLSCVTGAIEGFPTQFVETSPVFCDFAALDKAKVEWPSNREVRPLVCASGGTLQSAAPEAWLRRAGIILGD
ncbi:hypothetical protein J2R99_002192 [Rhodopseudomonas julia]|uniref:Secreted protein n=1 Tax=Rhodopseudomonas julia TaxID=200617 RepID=A0ABU0C730_9BRAD|nr:hypothetical protein [Rhodopseudomonas julia]MDQ0326323.1 hypothetical protein [Rhodopseudomonas julia]